MQLTQNSANCLCKMVITQLANWPVFPALLQLGGIETRASSRIQLAIESWLKQQDCNNLLVVPEYRLNTSPSTDETTDNPVLQAADRLLHSQRIDYALIKNVSVGKARLEVDTVIEVKTNYLCQPELKTRPAKACEQARAYGASCGTHDTYVLYVVVSAEGTAPGKPRDAGWSYFKPSHPSVSATGPINAGNVNVLGQYPNGNAGYPIPGTKAKIWACLLEP